MQRTWLETVGCIALALLLASSLVGAVSADAAQDGEEFPRAEAGLDQTVEQNASVLLDGSESFSPEGEIVSYDWAIGTPNGSRISPSCDSADCSLSRFRVPELGQYNVTLTVTDDDGREMSDTLYVTVVPRGDFGVTLTGPGSTGSEGNLTATLAPGDVAVHNISWYRDGEPLGNRSLPSTGGTFNKSTFIALGSTFRAVVNGSWSRTASDTWTAPGGANATFVPDNSGQYPRIEGPAVVTGDPDHVTEDGWQFTSTYYVLRTSQFGSVRRSTWRLEGSSVATNWFRRNKSLVTPRLEPGINVLTADVEITRGDGIRGPGEEVNNTHPDYYNLNESQRLIRRVLVDPAPQITRYDAFERNDVITIVFSGEDQYNPAEEIVITVDGTVVHSASPEAESISGPVTVDVPSATHGETTVGIRATDSRGQVASERTTVSLPRQGPTSEHSSLDNVEGYVFNREEDTIETGDGEVLLKEPY
jgi:hypothetical protein